MADISFSDPPEAPPALERARELLVRPPAPEPVWRLVAAAGFAAASALALAAAVILGPPQFEPQPPRPDLRPALSRAGIIEPDSVEPPSLLRSPT